MLSENTGGHKDDMVSVHSMLVVGGYVGCVASAVFSIVLVCLGPGPTNANGSLRYISEGMDLHCGYTTIVMGTCSILVLACQWVAALHMENRAAGWCALVEAVGWNVVIGVSDTGWTVHYVGLTLFLMSGLYYHTIASKDRSYGGDYYLRMNALAWFFTCVFACLAGVSIAMSQASATTTTTTTTTNNNNNKNTQTSNNTNNNNNNNDNDSSDATLRSFAVAFEFVLLLFMTVQNMLLIHALDQFRDIRLRFERYYS